MRTVIALDINSTIVEGDSMKGTAPSTLTGPAQKLMTHIKSMSKEKKPSIILYTFGADSSHVVGQMRQYGIKFPRENNFFIARSKNGEVWAFGSSSPHVNYNLKNPAIRETYKNVMFVNAHQNIGSDFGTYRFENIYKFGEFVVCLLKRGNIVCRACYDPGNDYFCQRSETHEEGCWFLKRDVKVSNRNKILSVNGTRPIIAFDDNPQDWEVDNGKIIEVVSPNNAENSTPTCFMSAL